MNTDLHTHTNCSDGQLEPRQLLDRAQNLGIELLAITDHDTVEAYRQLDNNATGNLKLVAGIELSSQWRKTGIHIVGLNIRLDSDAIGEGVAFQQRMRLERAGMIADRLAKLGLGDCLDTVAKIACNNNIGRVHFARHLVNTGAVKNAQQAFKKYLGAGKPGDIRHLWAEPEQIIRWIRDANGTAVLAHPAKYKLTCSKLHALVADFVNAGGQAMEVVSGKQPVEITRNLAALCRQHGLLASCGSDFHTPDQNWSEIGNFPDLPPDCYPVWEGW